MTEIDQEYAVALFGLAAESGIETDVLNGLLLARQVFEQTPELTAFLDSPGIPKSVRLDTVKRAFDADVPEYVVSFLCLLCETGNSELLDRCITTYEKLYNAAKNVSYVTVTSAVALTDAEKVRLCQSLEKKYGARIEATYKIDETLLGGVIVETDDTILDGSLRRRLHNMKGVMEA